jgi:hypothetical protein
MLSFFIFFFNLLLSGTYILAFSTGIIAPAILLFTVKLLADLFVFYSGSKIVPVKQLFWMIPFLELAYPFYIVITPLLAIKKPFEWKGRMYKK